MKIYKIKVNGKSYRVELESIEEVKSEKQVEKVEQKKEEYTADVLEKINNLKKILGIE